MNDTHTYAENHCQGNKSRYREVFRNPHVILPVIHVDSLDQALRNAHIARSAETDGVFLINHSILSAELLDIYAKVVAEFPDWWVGLNCLDLNVVQVFERIPPNVAGVWVDNAMIDEGTDEQPIAEYVLEVQKTNGFSGLYFGGVAFKYRKPVKDPRSAALKGAAYMDVVTTSGPGTGEAADIEKIRIMKEAAGASPLAIASGITPDNIRDYLPHSDCYLVATGISNSFDQLDPDLVRRLVDRVRGHTLDCHTLGPPSE